MARMPTIPESAVPGALDEMTVVDVDAHVSETVDHLTPYMDEGAANSLTSGRPVFIGMFGWDLSMRGRITTAYSDERAEKAISEGYADVLDEFNTDYAMLTPTKGSTINLFSDVDLACEVASAYNDFQLAELLDVDDRFRGAALVCFHDPQRAAAEIERVGDEDDIVGVYAASSGQNVPFGDPKFDPIYEAAEDHDLPIAYHATVKGGPTDFPKQNSGLSSFTGAHTLFHPWSQELTLTSLVEHGAPEKFPDLDWVFLEAGIGWVPYLLWRLDKHYLSRRSELPRLERKPSEYADDQFYYASQPIGEPDDPDHIKGMVDMIGADNLVYATDFPHFDFDAPIEPARQLGLDREETRQVFGENAMEVFDI